MITHIKQKLEIKESQWIWKNEKDDFETFFKIFNIDDRSEIIKQIFFYDISIFSFEITIFITQSDIMLWR